MTRTSIALLVVFSVFFVAASPTAQADEPDTPQVPGVSYGDTTAVITFTAKAVFVANFEALFDAERDHVSISPAELVCAQVGVISSDGEGNLNTRTLGVSSGALTSILMAIFAHAFSQSALKPSAATHSRALSQVRSADQVSASTRGT